jgi:glycosyltransferase involved in cell wall biosynthesis
MSTVALAKILNNFDYIDKLMPSISLCMIVKDEGQYLRQCLDSVNGLVDEIIVVDTGSMDDTMQIAAEYGARIFNFEWIGDFSKARNFSISHATKEWILILDADEFLTDNGKRRISALVLNGGHDAVRLIQHNYVNDVDHGGFLSLDLDDPNHDKYAGWFPVPVIRLFRNFRGVEYSGKVHEIVDNSLDSSKICVTEIKIHHYGFVSGRNKDELYGRIAAGLDENDPRQLYVKGAAYLNNGEIESAILSLEKAHDLAPKNLQISYVLASAYLKKDDANKCIELLEQARRLDIKRAETFDNPDCLAEICTNLSAAYLKKEEPEKSLSILHRCLEKHKNPKIYNNLAATYAFLGDLEKAAYFASAALKDFPNDITLLSNFASILSKMGKKDHARSVYERVMELKKNYYDI